MARFNLNSVIKTGMTSYSPSGGSASAGQFPSDKTPCFGILFYIKNDSAEDNDKFLTATVKYKRYTGDISDSNYIDTEWLPATMFTNTVNTTNDGEGFRNEIYWNVKLDCPNENNVHKVAFMMEVKYNDISVVDADNNSVFYFNSEDIIQNTSSFIKTTDPMFYWSDDSYLIKTPAYVNNSSFIIDTEQSDSLSGFVDVMSSDVMYYSFRQQGKTWSNWMEFTDLTKMQLSFESVGEVSEYILEVRVADAFFNKLADGSQGILTFSTILYNILPSECIVKIYGTNSNERYTGIIVNADGSFTPSRDVTIMFYGTSDLKMKCRVYSDNIKLPTISTTLGEDGVLVATVGETPEVYDTGFFDYKASEGVDHAVRPLNELICSLDGDDYNVSEPRAVNVEFVDEAGNSKIVTKTIILNNRVYKTSVRNIVNDNANYVPMVRKEGQAGSGAYITIPESYNSEQETFIRNWQDIYFPETHAPKYTQDGTIDIDWARRAGGQNESSSEKENYDPVVMSGDDIQYDDEGRVTTVWREQTGVTGGVNTKQYDNLVSSSSATLKYWVIDNTGYGDIKLTFEQFHMDINPGSPPYNGLSPYKGDCVVIYNADNEECLEAVKQPDGTITYPISGLNTNLMEILSVFTGDGTDRSIIDYVTGNAVTMLSDGSFVAEYNFVNRICIVVYTNGNGQKTGFKIKAGAKQRLSYSNYDLDAVNGELWVHEEANNGRAPGVGVGVRLYYSYYDSVVKYDNDNGRIIMNVSGIPENAIVTADYSYYKKEEDKTDADRSRLFISSDDDYYDYLPPNIYVTPRYSEMNKQGDPYDYDIKNPGKLSTTYYLVDPDRGCIDIISGGLNGEYYYIPKDSRLTIDYTHHSFYRLSNDGFGDVTFQDSTIVAAITPVYRDVTWCDLMFINEGDAIFESGKIKMTARGEVDSSGKQTKFVDPDRPWDAQMGTADATYKKARIYITTNYSSTATTNGALIYSSNPTVEDLRKVWNAAGDATQGVTLAGVGGYISPREYIYGRVIWSLGGSSGSGHPQDTVGKKCWGSVINGKYYSLEV